MKQMTLTLLEAVNYNLVLNMCFDGEFSMWSLTDQIRKDVEIEKYSIEGDDDDILVTDVKAEFDESPMSEAFEVVRFEQSASGNFRVFQSFKDGIEEVKNNLTKSQTKIDISKEDVDQSNPFAKTNSSAGVGVEDRSNILDLIDPYLRNKGSATLKEIQSRLKTKGITCEEIYKFCVKQDYMVDQSGTFCQWTASV